MPVPATTGNWSALVVPNSLVVVNWTSPRSMLIPSTKLLSCPRIFSDEAPCTVPPKLLVDVQVRSISPKTLVPKMPAAETVCPPVVMSGDELPSRLGKHSNDDGAGQGVASVPLPSTWLCQKPR